MNLAVLLVLAMSLRTLERGSFAFNVNHGTRWKRRQSRCIYLNLQPDDKGSVGELLDWSVSVCVFYDDFSFFKGESK